MVESDVLEDVLALDCELVESDVLEELDWLETDVLEELDWLEALLKDDLDESEKPRLDDEVNDATVDELLLDWLEALDCELLELLLELVDATCSLCKDRSYSAPRTFRDVCRNKFQMLSAGLNSVPSRPHGPSY